MGTEAARKINPDIKKTDVGIMEIREISVYPLSMSDQAVLTEDLAKIIVETANKFQKEDEKSTDEESILFLRDLIVTNLERLLEYVTTQEERPTLQELTNNQFYRIADIVFTVNYEGLIKNFKDLFTRMGSLMKLPTDQKIG